MNRTIHFEACPKNRRDKMRIIEGGETIIFREHRMRRHTRISASRLFQLANDDSSGQYNLFSAGRDALQRVHDSSGARTSSSAGLQGISGAAEH